MSVERNQEGQRLKDSGAQVLEWGQCQNEWGVGGIHQEELHVQEWDGNVRKAHLALTVQC